MCGMLIAFAFVFVFVGGAEDEKAGSWVNGPQHHATPRHTRHTIKTTSFSSALYSGRKQDRREWE